MKLSKINILFLILVSVSILAGSLFLPARLYGDGNEYFLTLESVSNHLTPDLQQEDIDEFYIGNLNIFNKQIDPYSGYLKSVDNRFYAIHFWAYSLINAPVKLFLDSINIDSRKTFQFFNAILFVILLNVIIFLSGLSEKQKSIFILLILFSPIIWFIHWTHPEIFMFTFITLALICMNNADSLNDIISSPNRSEERSIKARYHSQRVCGIANSSSIKALYSHPKGCGFRARICYKNEYFAAIFFAGIASLQNQAIIPFVLFLWIKAVMNSESRFKDSIRYGLPALIIFIPNLFYFITFGKFSLLDNAVSISNISAFRIFELFFDLNIGFFPYLPLLLLLFFGIVFWKVFQARKFVLEFQLLIVLLAMMLICAMTGNWNSGTIGPARYAIWMIPIIFFIIIKNLDYILNSKFIRFFFIFSIIIQLLLISSLSIQSMNALNLITKDSILTHAVQGYAARMALNIIPGVYNPSFEIFCERTLHKEIECKNPTAYKNNNECKKAILTCEGLDKLKAECGSVPEKIQSKCNINKKNDWFYVNY